MRPALVADLNTSQRRDRSRLRFAGLALIILGSTMLAGCAESWHCGGSTGPHFGRSREGEHRCSDQEMRRAGYSLQCETVFVDRWTGTEEECHWVR